MKKLYKISDFFTEEDNRFTLSGYAPTDTEHTAITVVTKEDFFDAVPLNMERGAYLYQRQIRH